ncbi:MAG TPA: GNAT family protein [Methylomirabilota bacterium]|nr:GNAT family protein [Methylomirabilota bacterium]
MELRLAHCTLRPWRRGDEASLVRHANNRNVSRNLRDRFPYPYTAADADAWISSMVGQAPPTSLAIEVQGEVVGGIGLQLGTDVQRRSAEIGYWLAEPFWGRGIATEALRAMTAYAFEQFDLVRLEAGVFSWNPASGRVLEKCGYVLEGRARAAVVKDGRTGDRLLYGLIRAGAIQGSRAGAA